MKHRTLSELYQIVYNECKDFSDTDKAMYAGICELLSDLYIKGYITEKEEIRLSRDIYKNKPRIGLHEEFYTKRVLLRFSGFFFPPSIWGVRKQFIFKMINYSKPWYIKLLEKWKQPIK